MKKGLTIHEADTTPRHGLIQVGRDDQRKKSRVTHTRRLFITEGAEHYQLLSLSQALDGSIYLTSPNLTESRWLELQPGDPPAMRITEVPDAGKLSVHGSGISHVRRTTDGEVELRLAGNYLADLPAKALGLRHVVTLFATKPTHLPRSPASARLSDCSILADQMKPYVLVFWAVPAVRRMTVTVQGSFNVNELATDPPELGFGGFALRTHWIAWFAYRTKHMDRWPAHSLLCFYDGFYVPLLIGTGVGEFRLELSPGQYAIDGDQLTIAILRPIVCSS